jgi:hypothetical protein
MIARLKLRILSILVVVVLVLLAAWLLTRPRKQVEVWTLPDGSVISLAGVTYGKNHEIRYDNRWQDYLSPVIPSNLRAKLGARVASHMPASSNAVVIWLWRDNSARNPINPEMPIYLTTVDENGLEGEMQYSGDDNYSLPNGKNLSGWEMRQVPRSAKEIGIRVYVPGTEQLVPITEFKVKNRLKKPPVVWSAEALSATRKTNGVEVTLEKLITGLTKQESGLGPAGENARAFTRAIFSLREDGKPTKQWQVTDVQAVSASGETRGGGSSASRWKGDEQYYNFPGSLWPDEPAWKLKVRVSRTTDYPAEELWTIKDVPVPKDGEVIKLDKQTNLHGAEISLLGISGPKAKLPEDWAVAGVEVNLHARTPIPMSDTQLKLVEVKDDQGRKVEVKGSSSNNSTGGRGATQREMNHAFGIKVPEGAKSLEVTFAFSKSRTVEFMVKPEMGE